MQHCLGVHLGWEALPRFRPTVQFLPSGATGPEQSSFIGEMDGASVANDGKTSVLRGGRWYKEGSMRFSAGTSGFSYSEWKGIFYPKDLKSPAMLGYYAGRLHSVEINNTFYRMPSQSLLAGWRAQVKDDFRFILKAPRRITHSEKLAGSEQSLALLLTTAASLGESLGPILFQLPPTFQKDLARLTLFLSWLPKNQRAAFEFRHPSWFSPDVYSALSAANAALCGGDVEDREKSPPLVPTADWGYLRLRKMSYTSDALATWAELISQQPWEAAYAFLKHETEGPLLAEKLDRLVTGSE